MGGRDGKVANLIGGKALFLYPGVNNLVWGGRGGKIRVIPYFKFVVRGAGENGKGRGIA